jgi:hypothetical protein
VRTSIAQLTGNLARRNGQIAIEADVIGDSLLCEPAARLIYAAVDAVRIPATFGPSVSARNENAVGVSDRANLGLVKDAV